MNGPRRCLAYPLSVLVLAFLALPPGPGLAAEPDKAPAPAPKAEAGWKALFDGKSLDGWKPADFFRAGKVHVQDGAIVMEKGQMMTGVTYTRGDFPKMDYEVTLEGKKLAGNDFFCTTTFPVGDSFCSLVVGGWGGRVVGLSSINGADASENETNRDREFKPGQWYRLRIRVTQKRIEAWFDQDKLVDLDSEGRRLSIRVECGPCRPFGLATWDTAGAVRNVRVRLLGGESEKPAPAKVRVLLLGDSTVIGSICRREAPKADHLEDVIRKLLAAEADLPPVEVLNQGRDGEFVHGLLTGRYDKEIAKLPRVDVVLIRYGLNDRGRRQDFAANFPRDLRELIKRLKQDHPGCQVVLETVIPYLGEQADKQINDLVRGVAAEEKLPLLDTNARYAAELKHGHNMLNYRRVRLEKIPAKYHALLPAGAVKGGDVVVLDNTLDAHLRDVPGWFGDRHPNLAGYHVIGDEAARFLAPLIRERVRAASKP